MKRVDLYLVMVNLVVNDTKNVIEVAKSCPFVINAFRLSGKYNFCLFIASTDLEKLYNIVNEHFRKDSNIKKVSMQVVIESIKDFSLPLRFDNSISEPFFEDGCGKSCNFCRTDRKN